MAVMIVLSIGVGVGLGLLTKASLWIYGFLIDVVWEWLPDGLSIDATSLPWLLAVLVVGGLLVGVGQLRLGDPPKPLEETVAAVRAGEGIDPRSVPAAIGNTLAALTAGAPLGPESGLIAVLGGIYYEAKARMDASARRAFGLLTGAEDGPWRYAPAIIAGGALIVVFHLLPGGTDLSFVPAYRGGDEALALLLAIAAGAAGGILGVGARELEGRAHDLRLFERMPLVAGPVGGIAVALLAVPSTLVLFSGHEQMSVLFERRVDATELVYAGAAKLVAVVIVVGAGWKGGTIFPLMFIAGALAVGIADALGLEAVVLYAAAIGGAVAGALRSIALGLIIALLVVPSDLIPLIVVGAAAGVTALRISGGRTLRAGRDGPAPAG